MAPAMSSLWTPIRLRSTAYSCVGPRAHRHGSRPVIPDIEGLEEVPYLTSDLLTSEEPMELQALPLLCSLWGRIHRIGIGADVPSLRY